MPTPAGCRWFPRRGSRRVVTRGCCGWKSVPDPLFDSPSAWHWRSFRGCPAVSWETGRRCDRRWDLHRSPVPRPCWHLPTRRPRRGKPAFGPMRGLTAYRLMLPAGPGPHVSTMGPVTDRPSNVAWRPPRLARAPRGPVDFKRPFNDSKLRSTDPTQTPPRHLLPCHARLLPRRFAWSRRGQPSSPRQPRRNSPPWTTRHPPP